MRFKMRALWAFLLLLLPISAFAQTGTIVGQVFDPSGAVIGNAQITATSTQTGLVRTTVTTSAGLYSLPALSPSTYEVTATVPGFQTQTKKNVVLNVAATLPVNFTLAISGNTTTVSVMDASGATVETDNAQLSTVVDSKKIEELPLILRDPYQLVLLSPGVATATNNDGGVSVNGQRDRNNNFMLDGADNNDTSVPGGLGGITSASPDTAQEFRVITNAYDAEFGRNTGAIVDVVTRSGSNKFHGDAYEYGRYSALGARDFFNKTEDGGKDPYVRNDFGASIGGPIWKDRTFFFLNGEAERFRTTRTESQTTPTAAFKTGKFTFIDPYDGSTTDVDLTNYTTNDNNYTGLPMDATMKKLYSIMPVGSDNGDGVSTSYYFASPDPLNSYQFTGKFDHKLTTNHQVSLRYTYGHSNDADPSHDEVLPGYGNTSQITTQHSTAITLASILTPKIANQLKGGYNLNHAGFYCNHAGLDSLLGTDSYGNGRDIVIPYFFTMGCTSLGDSNGQARLSSTLYLADTLNWALGAHEFKFGGDFRSVKDNSYDNFSSRDTLSLNNYNTYGYASYNLSNPDSASLLNFEDMIWGATGAVANSSEYQFFYANGQRRSNDYTRFRQHEFSLFAQDTWKATPKLTLVGGLRYAFNGVPYEKDGNFANFYGDASVSLPSVGYFSFTRVGPGTGHQLYKDSWLMFEPRVGFSYAADEKTAIRGGFGIFHDRVFDNIFGNAKSNPPYQASWNDYPFTGDSSTPTVSTYLNPETLTPSANITNGSLNEPVVIDNNLKMPTTYQWSLGVQRQLTHNLMAEINYVGNHGIHGLREVDGAPPQAALVQQDLAAGIPASWLQTTALYTGVHYDSAGNEYDFPVAVYNTAFEHELLQVSRVSSSYNSLQTSLKGQIQNLNLTASYTFAHSLDNGSDPLVPGAGGAGMPRNSFDLTPEYGNSDFDVKQRFVFSAVYDLPIGKGAAYLNHGLAGHIFEGIQLSGIDTAQRGLPFDLRGTIDNLHTGLLNRPQLIGNAKAIKHGTISSKGKVTGVNRTAFANAAYGQNVSIHRNQYYGPSFFDTDLDFQKTQTLHNQMKIVFRVECYNILNHPNMEAPASGSISSSYFGISTSQVGQNDGTTGARQLQGALKFVF